MMVVDGVEVLDVREAADYVRRTPETVRRWVWSGRLSARRKGNRLLVARHELDALIGPAAPLSLGAWASALPGAATGGTAADLVLDDRAARQKPARAGR